MANTPNYRSDEKPGSKAEAEGKARASVFPADRQGKDQPQARTTPDQPEATGLDDAATAGPGQINRNRKSNTERSEAAQANAPKATRASPAAQDSHIDAATPHAANHANADRGAGAAPPAAPTAPAAERELPNLTFTAPRVTLDTHPDTAARAPAGATGTANLTSHLNDPAMRRNTQVDAQSGISPLTRDGATPGDESARLQQDASAADARARRKGMDPRGDVQAWHQAEENRQSDLPGSPRKDLPA